MTKRPLDNNEEPKENKKQRIEQSSSDSENDSQEELLQIISQVKAEKLAFEESICIANPELALVRAILSNDVKKVKNCFNNELNLYERFKTNEFLLIMKRGLNKLLHKKFFEEIDDSDVIDYDLEGTDSHEVYHFNLAAKLGYVDIVEFLLSMNRFGYLDSNNMRHSFFSVCRARKNAFSIFKLLVDKGLDIDLDYLGEADTYLILEAAEPSNPAIINKDYRIVDYLLKAYLNEQTKDLTNDLKDIILDQSYLIDSHIGAQNIIKDRIKIVIKDYIKKGTEKIEFSEGESDSDNNYNKMLKDAIAKAKVEIEKEIEIAFKEATIIPKILNRYGDVKGLILEFLGIPGSISLIELENSVRQPIVSNILKEEGLTYFDVEGDGNCFYHAVSRQLSLLDIEISHTELRALAIDEMRNHPETYIDGFTSRDVMDRYIDNHSREGTWAEGAIISALSNILHLGEHNVLLEIRHYNPNTETIITMPTPDGTGKVIRVLHNLVHYQSIEELETLNEDEDSSSLSELSEDEGEDQGSSSQSELSEDEEISGHHIDQVYNTEENPNYTNEQETSFNNTASNYTNPPISSEPLNDDNVDWALAALITGSVSDDSINPSF